MNGETVVVLRAPAGDKDRYGNATRDWPSATRRDVAGCAVAPRNVPEDTGEGRQAVTIGLTVYMPPGADVLATDRVECRGRVYEVDGEPSLWVSPFAPEAFGIEVALRQTEG